MRDILLRRDGTRTWALIFDKGDEVVSELERFARDGGLTGSHFTAVGAFERVTLGYFDRDRKDFLQIPIREQVEVLSLVGDIALKGIEPKAHAHVVVGRQDGTTRGGHLIEASVWPTLEVVLTDEPEELRRVHDEETGLALIEAARAAAERVR
jgi:predicted DNA-binding protein with PD1-like motif